MEVYMVLGGVFVLVLLWRGLGGASRANIAHREAMIRLPGKLAMEVGDAYAHRQAAVWRLWYDDAKIRYAATEKAWWAQYHRCSSGRRRKMLERRLILQKDIGDLIDPIECLRKLIDISRSSLENKPPQTQDANPLC